MSLGSHHSKTFALKASIVALCLALPFHSTHVAAQSSPETIAIDANAPGTPFPHFWEQMFGSGRLALALRARYQSDLRDVKEATNVRYVRGHAILHDELG